MKFSIIIDRRNNTARVIATGKEIPVDIKTNNSAIRNSLINIAAAWYMEEKRIRKANMGHPDVAA